MGALRVRSTGKCLFFPIPFRDLWAAGDSGAAKIESITNIIRLFEGSKPCKLSRRISVSPFMYSD